MSAVIVMKFGGTSVADPEKIQRAADRAIARRRAGHRVVVVVSAPGDMTDELIELAKRVAPNPESRELDMLMATGEQVSIALFAIACRARGVPAVSLTGPQAGILADERHTKARIVEIRPSKVHQELARGNIVTVAGFQGLNPRRDIATLGRGGSDLTAVALAAALKAKHCEIYTDVHGVYTADPRLVPEARLIPAISYDEMLELAGAGAQVMQSRSIEVAKKFGVRIQVAHAFEDGSPGTWIIEEVSSMEEALVTGVALDRNQIKVTIRDVPDRPGMAAEVFGALGKANVNVDMIVQSSARGAINDISFTTPTDDLEAALKALKQVQRHWETGSIEHNANVAKISVVGVGMRSHSGVAGRMFRTLADNSVNIQMIATSEIKISCIVDQKEGERALRCLHKAFGLQRKR
ncbi:MAG: aspartate kinase [Elusimicrobia bacterium]|nr:aspartate kinase [Elusimicrobiota bacterium]